MTITVTTTNPAGVEAFNLRRLAPLPEYQACMIAMNELIHAMERAVVDITQVEWLEAVGHMAAAVPFCDNCSRCEDRGLDAAERIVAPYAVEFDDEQQNWIVAGYRCTRCGASWECGWSTEAPSLF
jgi:hypothetical protein